MSEYSGNAAIVTRILPVSVTVPASDVLPESRQTLAVNSVTRQMPITFRRIAIYPVLMPDAAVISLILSVICATFENSENKITTEAHNPSINAISAFFGFRVRAIITAATDNAQTETMLIKS